MNTVLKKKNIKYFMAFEEPCSFLVGDEMCFDEDGISTALFVSDAIKYLNNIENKEISQVIDEIYKEIGFYYSTKKTTFIINDKNPEFNQITKNVFDKITSQIIEKRGIGKEKILKTTLYKSEKELKKD